MIPGATASFFLSREEIDGILSGSLEAVFRKEKVAEPFDVFHLDGRAFYVIGVAALGMESLAEYAYRDAGFGSASEFASSLSEMMGCLDDNTPVYIHHIGECACGNCIKGCMGRLCEDWRGWGWMP